MTEQNRSFSRFSITGVSVLGVLAASAIAVACSSSRGSGFGQETATQEPTGGTDQDNGLFTEDAGPRPPAGCVPDSANFDIPGNNCDDDNDGTVDNAPTCDASLSAGGSAEDFARAIGICANAADHGYGLVSATYTRGYQRTDAPSSKQHGLFAGFGNVIVPREGAMLGSLSTGSAAATGTSIGDILGFPAPGAVPPGYPKAAANCPVDSKVFDVSSLKLELKAPKNASGIQFDFNFFSTEWPKFICTKFNDGFIAYLTAKGFNGGVAENVSFDASNNPVSVNNGFFDRCTPNVEVGCEGQSTQKSTCPGGPAELAGTRFGTTGNYCADSSTSGGATGWLTSTAPVEPGETFTIEFMIWDTGDSRLDSTVLLDHFTWKEGKVETETERPR